MGRVGEKVVPGRGRWTLVAGLKSFLWRCFSMVRVQRIAFMLHGKGSTHQRYLQEENKEAMQEGNSQEGITERIQIASGSGASKETDTATIQRLSMAGVGEGPIGTCIVGEPGGRDTLEGWSGRPDLKWRERPYILLSRPTQDSPQSEGIRGKEIGDTYTEGRRTRH